MEKATLTLAIPPKLKDEMNEIKGVNWSEETRQFLQERVQKLKLLKVRMYVKVYARVSLCYPVYFDRVRDVVDTLNASPSAPCYPWCRHV